MANPLAEYVQAPSPIWDFTDSRTYYDGLWDQGLWPPEGVRGLGQFNNVWRPLFAGDRGRLLNAAAMGMAGLGQGFQQYDQFIVPGRGQWGLGQFPTDCPSGQIACPDYPDTSTCTCASPTTPGVDIYQIGSGGKLLPTSTLLTSAPSGSTQAVMLTQQPTSTPSTGLSTNTIIGLSVAALAVLLLIGMRR